VHALKVVLGPELIVAGRDHTKKLRSNFISSRTSGSNRLGLQLYEMVANLLFKSFLVLAIQH
jgi:hypothetical protein